MDRSIKAGRLLVVDAQTDRGLRGRQPPRQARTTRRQTETQALQIDAEAKKRIAT